jgi:hypothetical protein
VQVGSVVVCCAVAACGADRRRPASAPAAPSFIVHVTPGSHVFTSPVVRRGATRWLAIGLAMANRPTTLRVYRRRGAGWSLDGSVEVTSLPAIEGLGIASITRSGAPDFTLRAYGADTLWFAVVSRIGGRWRAARFDYQEGPTAAIDACCVAHGLVKAEVDGCGCAAGPETYTWYRFDGRRFVPRAPPGPAAACTPGALARGRPVLSGQPVVDADVFAHLATPFTVARAACADGWALATGTLGGAARLGVFQQEGRRWLRAGIGTPAAVGRRKLDFAAPRSLLVRLAARLHVRLGRAPRYGTGLDDPSRDGLHGPEVGTVPVRLSPGSTFAESYVVKRHGLHWFATAVQSEPTAGGRRSTVAVNVYRWVRRRWARRATLSLHPVTAHREAKLSNFGAASLTGAVAPDFELGSSDEPGWLAVISKAGRTWHAVAFKSARGPLRRVVDAGGFDRDVIPSWAGPHVKLRYWYYRGRFITTDAGEAAPDCVLGFRRAACAYGWGLAAGRLHGDTMVRVYEDYGDGVWSWQGTVRPAQLRGSEATTLMPRWLLDALERRVLG